MAFLIIFIGIAGLVLLITWGKVNPFLAFLIVSIVAGLFLGISFNKIIASVQKGIGDTLGSLVMIIVLGAMLGKAGLEAVDVEGIAFSPLKGLHLSDDVRLNYLVAAVHS